MEFDVERTDRYDHLSLTPTRRETRRRSTRRCLRRATPRLPLPSRDHVPRCYRNANDAQKVLNEIRYTHLPKRRREIRRENARLERFLGFIRGTSGDPATAAELEEFVRG